MGLTILCVKITQQPLQKPTKEKKWCNRIDITLIWKMPPEIEYWRQCISSEYFFLCTCMKIESVR